MDSEVKNELVKSGNILANSGNENAPAGSNRLRILVGRRRPTIRVSPFLQLSGRINHVRIVCDKQSIPQNLQTNIVLSVPTSAVGNLDTRARFSVPSLRTNLPWGRNLPTVTPPERFGLQVPCPDAYRSNNCVRNYRPAIRPILSYIPVSACSNILTIVSGTDSPIVGMSSSSQQTRGISNVRFVLLPTVPPARYGLLTPDGEHIVCQNCGSCVDLSNGTFSNFVLHLKKDCVAKTNKSNGERISLPKNSSQCVTVGAPSTSASLQTNCSSEKVGPVGRSVRRPMTEHEPFDWTRYGGRTGYRGTIVCKLCGANSFPFLSVAGFLKHLQMFHVSVIQPMLKAN